MRKIAFTSMVAFILLGATRVRAQECCPAWEVFGGYSYFSSSSSSDRITSDQFNNRYGMDGFAINFARNISNKLGIVADYSFNKRESLIGGIGIDGETIGGARADLKAHTFLFGPRFSARSDESNFFFHAMAGASKRKSDVRGMLDSGVSINSDSSSTGFALGFGGGVDIYASDHISVRLFQFDYIPVRARTDRSNKAWSHNYRLQTGITLRWGLVK